MYCYVKYIYYICYSINLKPKEMENLIPTDYDQKLTLKDIQNWNSFSLVKRIVEIKGFYTCMIEDKKTLIVTN